MSDVSPNIWGSAFDSETMRIMGEAFDMIINALPQTGQPALVRQVVANRIIEIVEKGEREPNAIARRALKERGVDGLV